MSDPMLPETAAPPTSAFGQPMAFGDVYNLYKDSQKKVPFVSRMTMPEFSAFMIHQTGDQSFQAGLEDSKLKRANSAVNRFLQPASNLTAQAGEAIGGVFGPGGAEVGRDIGQGFPRGLVDVGMAAVGTGLLAAPDPTLVTKGAGAGLLGLAGLSAGANVYEQTDSVPRAAVAGVVNMAMPGAASFAEKQVANALIKTPLYKTVDYGLRVPAKPTSKVAGMTERFAEYLGANVGAGAVQEAGIQVDSLIADGTTRPFDKDHMIEMFAGQLPFAALDAYRLVRGPGGNVNRSVAAQTSAGRAAERYEAEAKLAAEREVDSALKTYNKDRKLLPAPPLVTSPGDEGLSQVRKPTGGQINLDQGSIPSRPYGGFVEINNFQFPVNLLPTLVEAEAWLGANRDSVSPGSIARQFKLKTPEDTMAVMDALVKRGVLGEVKVDGRHAVKAKAPSARDVIFEQLKYNFPKVYERMLKDSMLPPAEPFKLATEEPTTNGKPTFGDKKAAAPADSQGMSPALRTILAANPDIAFPLAWTRVKKQVKDADFKVFKGLWMREGPGFGKKPAAAGPAGPADLPFSQPFDFGNKKPGLMTEQEQLAGQVKEVSKDTGQDFMDSLVMHPHEMLVYKERITRDLKGFLTEVYKDQGLETLNKIQDLDFDTYVKGLEERGHSADEIVKMSINKAQLQLGEMALRKYLQDSRDVTSADARNVKEYKEVEALLNRMDEEVMAKQFDPGFDRERLQYENYLKEQKRRAETGKKVMELPDPPESPWDVLTRARNYIEEYETRGPIIGGVKNPMASDTHAFGPADYVYAEGVRFYDDKAKHIKEYAERTGQANIGLEPHKLEAAALYDFVLKEGKRRAARIAEKVIKKQESLESGQSWDEDKYDAERALHKKEVKSAGTLREQSDTDFVDTDPEAMAAEAKRRGDILAALPDKFDGYTVRKIREAIGKKSHAGIERWLDSFNTTIQMFRDGVIEIRPVAKQSTDTKEYRKYGVRLRPESGIKFQDLPALLKMKNPSSVLQFLDNDFLPAMQHVAEMGKKELAAGRDPKKLWQPPTFDFNSPKGWGQAEGSTEGVSKTHIGSSDHIKESKYTSDTKLDAAIPIVAPWSFAESTERYFKSYFTNKGYSEEHTAKLTDVSIKIAALFQERQGIRVAELVERHSSDTRVKGAAIRYGRDNSIVGLNKKDFFRSSALNDWHNFQVLGHEFAHISESNIAYKNAMNAITDMTPENRSELIRSLFELAVPKEVQGDENFQRMVMNRSNLVADSPKETLADMTGIFVAGIASPSSKARIKDLLEHGSFMPDYATDFMKGMYANLFDSFESVAIYLKGIGVRPDGALEAVKHLREALNSAEVAERVKSQWAEIKRTRDADFISLITDPPVKPFSIYNTYGADRSTAQLSAFGGMRKALGLEGLPEAEKYLGVVPGFLEKVFMPIRQLAEKYPQLRDVADLGYEFLSMARQSQSKILEPFLTEGVLGRSKIDYAGTGVSKVLRSPKATEAFNKIALIKNEHGQSDSKFTVFTDAEMRRYMPDVDPKLQDSVIAMHRALEDSAPRAAKVLVDGRYNQLSLFAARALLRSNPTNGWQQARKDGAGLVNMLRAGIPVDPALTARWATGVDSALSILMDGHAEGKSLMAKTQTLEVNLANRPWWTPEVRLGRYMVAWKDGAAGFETRDAAIKFADAKDKAGIKARVWDKYVKNDDLSGMHPLLLEHFKEIEEAGFKAAMTAYSKGDMDLRDQLLESFKPGENTWKQYMGRGATASLLPRKLREGRETVDIFRGYLNYVSGVTNGMARDSVKHTMALIESDPIMQANPALKQLGRDYIQTVITPPTREWSKVKNLNFLWFMGGNISSMLLEYSQPMVSVAPHFIQATNNVPLTFKTMLSAATDIALGKVTDAEKAAMKRAADDGVLDFGVLSEFYEADDLAVANLKRLGDGEENMLTGAKDMAKKAWYMYGHAMRSLYAVSSRWNNQLTFLTAHRLAEGGHVKGIGKEHVYNYAKQATPTATYTGGPSARPVGMFANSGKFFGSVGAMYSLQSYTFTAISNMARLGSQAIDKQLTGAERTAARKAFGTIMLSQMALGGAMGLPFAASLVALVEQLFGVSVKPSVEQAAQDFAGLFTDDDEIQQLIADTGMRGIASRIFGADIASRTSLSNVLGVDSYNGFSLETLIGPTGSVLKGFVNATRSAAQGQGVDALQQGLPNAYKNVVKLARYGDEVRDNQGRLITHATPTEQAMMVIGLKPKRIAEYQAASNMMKQTELVASREHSRWLQDTAKVLIGGNPQQVRAMIMERAQAEGANPRVLAQRVAETAQELTIPFNPLDTGSVANANTRQQIASFFPGALPQRVSETAKLQQRVSLESAIGIPGAGRIRPAAMQRAAMIDQLLSMSPTMSRQEASLIVDQQLAPRGSAF